MTTPYPYTPPVSPVIAGTVVRFYTLQPFEDVTGTPMNPDRVIFAWSIGGGATTQCEYNVAGLYTIVRSATGYFYVDIDTTGLDGLWTYSWIGISVDGVVQTRDEKKLLVKPPTVIATI